MQSKRLPPCISALHLWLRNPTNIYETEHLALALETPTALLLLDDGHARRFGRLLGLRMTGTVGVLARATREGLVPHLAPLLDRLDRLGFRLSAQARAMALTLVGEPPSVAG